YVLCFDCVCVCFFFFQAEDGIRDRNVTGVQTCALPICIGVFPLYIVPSKSIKYPLYLNNIHIPLCFCFLSGFVIVHLQHFPPADKFSCEITSLSGNISR